MKLKPYNEIRAAQTLMALDFNLRNEIDDEEIFESWLMCGVPDGTEHWSELLPLSQEEFNEMLKLAKNIRDEYKKVCG